MVSTATAELLAEAAAMLAFARGGGGGGGAGAAAALAKGVGKQAGAGQDAAAAERKAPVGVGESAPAVGTLRGLRSLSEVAAAAGLSPTTFPSTAGKGSGAGGSADAAVSALARARLETFRRASVEQLRARLEGDGAGGDDGGEEEEGEDVDDEDEEEEDGEADEDDEDDEADALDGTDASPEGTAAAGPLLDIGAIIRHRAAASAAAAVAAAGTGMTGTGTAGAAKGRVSRPLPSAPVRRSAGDVAALSEVARGDWAQLFCAPSARSSPSLSLSSPASASAEATAQAWERAVEGVLGDAASRRALAAFSRDVLCVSAAAHTPKRTSPVVFYPYDLPHLARMRLVCRLTLCFVVCHICISSPSQSPRPLARVHSASRESGTRPPQRLPSGLRRLPLQGRGLPLPVLLQLRERPPGRVWFVSAVPGASRACRARTSKGCAACAPRSCVCTRSTAQMSARSRASLSRVRQRSRGPSWATRPTQLRPQRRRPRTWRAFAWGCGNNSN